MPVLNIYMDGQAVGSLEYSSLERGDAEAGSRITRELQRLTGAKDLYLCKTDLGGSMNLRDLEWFNRPTDMNAAGREHLLNHFFRKGLVDFKYERDVNLYCAVLRRL